MYKKQISMFAVVVFAFALPSFAQAKQAAPKSKAPIGNMALKRRWIAADRIKTYTDAQLPEIIRDRIVVKLQTNANHIVDVEHLDWDAEYIRPFVLEVLAPLEREYLKRFQRRIRINAAFRTIEHHEELRGRNSNAARGISPHSTGYTIDIGYAWMSPAEQRFVEAWLRSRHGKTIVYTKEYFQKCYDVFFRPPRLTPPPHHRKTRKR